ncbi:stress response protein nst1-like protein [Lasius niger]|uniref:Stress response protein nst1-like protein n=1 Tax=Lasius niger TaxID=67767 RepID=A0A0J7KUM0_LASNI|nr:stress response protein nst1-like protein [Lasius niger]
MNVLLQKHGAKHIYKVPEGLRELCADIAREAAFRGHYERMLLNESRGMIQWQRAATRTLEILRKAGASQAEASRAAILIQATYRGYYTRRNLKMKMMAVQSQEEKEGDVDMIESKETIQAVAWLDMMYEESELTQTKANEAASIIQKAYRRYRQKKNKREPRETIQAWLDMMYEESGLTQTKANEAASIIQKAYRRYRQKKNNYNTPRIESTRSMVVEAIVKNLHEKVFDEVMTHADIPTEFGNRKDLTKASEELQRTLKDRLIRARMMEEGGYNEQEFVRTEVSESFTGPENYDTYLELKDREEGRGIAVETEREGTYVRD